MGTSSVAYSFNSLAGNWSGPAALCGSILANSLRTPSCVTVIRSTGGWGLGPILGMVVVSSSLVKTEEN